jgi:hypothetical protein
MTLCAKKSTQATPFFFGETDSNTVSHHEDMHACLTTKLQGASNPGTHSKEGCSLGAVLDELAKRKERFLRTPCHPCRSPGMIVTDSSLFFILKLEINISRVIFWTKLGTGPVRKNSR